MDQGLKIIVFLLFCQLTALPVVLMAQDTSEKIEPISLEGDIVLVRMDAEDTLFFSDLPEISITSKRTFESGLEYRTYLRYKRYATVVYPYATNAIRIFKESENATLSMKSRQRRKYLRKLQKELKNDFEDKLKGLTKIQGMILVKMIEKDLDTPLFDLIKNLRGRFTAGYWGTLGRLFGYNLRTGYVRGEDTILDMVLDDFDISPLE